MRVNCGRLLFAALFSLATVIFAAGQQPSPEEVQIKQFREEIKVLVDKPPTSEAMLEKHRTALLTLRHDLRDLLMQKMGALKKDIRDYTRPNSSATLQTYVSALQEDLRNVETELRELDADIAGVPKPVSTPIQPNDTATTTESLAPSETQKAFDEEVRSFTPEKLAAAAAPAEIMESNIPAVSCSALVSDARPDRFSKYDQAVCFWARKISRRKAQSATEGVRLSQDKGNLLTVMIAKLLKTESAESYVSFVTEATEERTDQQTGAGSTSRGTTSLVSKGGVPSALGFAVENGAAVETRSGTTATFRINPAGLIDLFAKKGFITGFRATEKDPALGFLRKTSVGLSFDTDRGAEPGIFTGDRQQLSAVSVRYEFVNQRDPRHRKYAADWEKLTSTLGEEFAGTTWATTRVIQNFGTQDEPLEKLKDPALQAWLVQTNGVLAGTQPDIDQLAEVIRNRANALPVDLVTAETVDAVEKFAQSFQAYEEGKNRLLEKIARGKIFTLEYTNKREVNAPDTSNFNFIAATGAGSRISLTSNGSLTLFNKLPAAVSLTSPRPNRIRDFQFAGQIDVPLGQFDFWFSGRYERLLEDAITQAGTTMPNTRGDIAVGQFGLNIPIKSLGIKFPVSFTFANRTELVKEREVRGNFGFTFNWDTLWSRLKPF